jgi:hypothetical protein
MLALPPFEASTPRETAFDSGRCLSTDAVEALLRYFISKRWQRLQPEYADPLGMLMNRGARQWTAGWAPHGNTLYLLVWETSSFDTPAHWKLYENGTLIYLEQDKGPRSNAFGQLLESKQLPFVSYEHWLEPLLHHRHEREARQEATQALLNTLLARPEVFDALKNPIFKALEADLGNPDWPLLELLKLHRLAHKNPLVHLFKQLVQTGFIRTQADMERLDRALTLLQKDYILYGNHIAPIVRPLYIQAFEEFRQLITDGYWRATLRVKSPLYSR